MVTLLRYLLKYYFVILFILLESIALYVFLKANPYQNTRFYSFSLNVNGAFSKKYTNATQYLDLDEINHQLAEENIKLKNELASYASKRTENYIDTTRGRHFEYISARVINNTTSKQYNYILLDKGSRNGIEPEMAVITPYGVVGIVEQVSENFARVISVLNLHLPVSGKFKKNQYQGSFLWDGRDHRDGDLKNIPLDLDVAVGDTIVTTGFGTFPEGVNIGLVHEAEKGQINFYNIKVRLSNDFRTLHEVYVIKDNYKEERSTIDK